MNHVRFFLLSLALLPAISAFAQPTAPINQKDAKGRKQGPWERTWAESQQVRYKGQFKDDKPMGSFTYYGTDGKVESIVDHYATGGASHARHFHPSGKLMAEGRYVGEAKDSVWNYWDEAGRLRGTERWKIGKQHGDQESFFENGNVAERCAWVDGQPHGTFAQFHDNGKTRITYPYMKGQADGLYQVFDENGRKELEGKYVKGERHGAWLYYNSDGSMRIQMLYENDEFIRDKKENGTFKTYYPDEQVESEVTWKHGKKEGRFVLYYHNGRWVDKPTSLGPEGREKQDTQRVLEGQTIQMEGTYKNDYYHGEVKEYSETGKLLTTTTYIDGVAQPKSRP